MMEDEIEDCIRKKIQWLQLPATVKKLLGDSSKEYERYIFEFSIKNQLRFRGSLVRTVRKDEKKYYETLIQSSIQRLMLYPYHLADMIVKGLRITPFIYYVEVVALLIEMEKSYDTMPNFTAADCLRLLGIGRNEYLELVAKARSLGRRGRSKAIRGLLPKVPMNIPMQPWWRVELGYVLEEDVKPLSESEKALIDMLIDRGSQTAGTLDYNVVKTLYRRGLIYLDVPITAEDKVSVPPLKGFVMNRIAGDYFETLLYKVFVSIDEHTTVAELANVLQVECELVKQAVSLYCRVGFAHHLRPPPATLHPSWRYAHTHPQHPPYRQISPLTYDPSTDDDVLQMEPVLITEEPSTSKQKYDEIVKDNSSAGGGRRVAVLFDSTLAAYLMMGNLSPDLKSHAVTLFEVGKLCDESLGSLLMELDKVAADPEIEGEARRYLAAARCLRIALRTLRPKLRPLDLLRCEALHALGTQARARLLATKYRLAISTAPLCREARAGVAAGSLPHLGPAPAESHTPWMRLYLYHVAGYGPPTILLTKGTVLRCVPRALLGYSRLWVWWWGSDSTLEGGASLSAPAALRAANLALRRAPVMLQAAAVRAVTTPAHLMFPPASDTSDSQMQSLWNRHAGLRRLLQRLRLHRSIGYVTLADIGVPDLGCAHPPASVQLVPLRKKKEICGIAKPVSEISLSSTDSTEKTTADYTKRLQSPIESHFAVTPTIESKASSPANGFTSVESGQLLCEELDNLAIDSTKTSHQSKESIAGSDDIVPINSLSTSIEDIKEKADEIKRHVEKSMSKESITYSDDLVPINSTSVSIENLKFDSKKSSFSEKSIGQYNDLMSPAEESVSMFTQLSNKLTEMTTEGDSGVDTAHNFSDEETCKPEKWTILDLQFGIPLFDESLCEKICHFIVERISNPDILDTVKEDNDFIRADVLKFVSQCQYYPGEDMGIVKRGTLVPLPRKNLVFENGRISEWTGK